MPRLRSAVVMLCQALVIVVAGAGPPKASAEVISVSSAAELTTALARARAGDTIRLAPVAFPVLEISGRRYSGPVRLVGSSATTLAGLTINRSANIVVEGVRVTPAQVKAVVRVTASQALTFRRVTLDGVTSARGVEMLLDSHTTDVRIEASEFTHCRMGRPCLQPSGRDVTVVGSWFHDCTNCDMIRAGGSGITLRGNTFERALAGECTSTSCNHNDLIQIMGGGPWTIVQNRFGERNRGAAQVYLAHGIRNSTNPIHDVVIASNIFWGDMHHAITVGSRRDGPPIGPPRRVSIVNNTIFSGRTSAVFVSSHYANVGVDERPLVANNVLRVLRKSECARIRAVGNVVMSGASCGERDRLGDPRLDGRYAPTAASTLLIDAADPRYAPAVDHFGRARVGRPDIGAIEHGAATRASLSAPARVRYSIRALRARRWRVTLTVRASGVTSLTVHVVRGRRRTLAFTRPPRGSGSMSVVFVLPRWARAPGTASLVLTGRGADGPAVTRRVAARLTR